MKITRNRTTQCATASRTFTGNPATVCHTITDIYITHAQINFTNIRKINSQAISIGTHPSDLLFISHVLEVRWSRIGRRYPLSHDRSKRPIRRPIGELTSGNFRDGSTHYRTHENTGKPRFKSCSFQAGNRPGGSPQPGSKKSMAKFSTLRRLRCSEPRTLRGFANRLMFSLPQANPLFPRIPLTARSQNRDFHPKPNGAGKHDEKG